MEHDGALSHRAISLKYLSGARIINAKLSRAWGETMPKQVLVIGGAGFVGRHLIAKLESLGYDVKTMDVAHSDIRKSLLDLSASDLKGFDCVVNLAAQTDVALAIASPRYTYEQNLLGAVALLEAIRYSQVRPRLVQISSESAYGVVPPERLPIREDESLNPPNVYSASKAAAEMAVQTFGAPVEPQIQERNRIPLPCQQIAKMAADEPVPACNEYICHPYTPLFSRDTANASAPPTISR